MRQSFSLFLILLLLLAGGCASKARVPANTSVPTKSAAVQSPKPAPAKKAVSNAGSTVFTVASEDEVFLFLAELELDDQDLHAWSDLREPLTRSLGYASERPEEGVALDVEGLRLTWGQLAYTASHLLEVLPVLEKDRSVLSRDFVWYRLNEDPLMTGYYAPEIEASLTPHPDYKYPLYGPPDDLKTLALGAVHPRWDGQRVWFRLENGKAVPYYDRYEIDIKGALKGRGLEIAWAKHPWDIYHLQVQGSGYLRLADGSTRYILYAGKNGRKFSSVTRQMLEEGILERGKVNRDGIREALDNSDEGALSLLSRNPSYVFFKLADIPPVGSIGRPLKGMVSLATDPELLPLGAIVPFSTSLPLDGKNPEAVCAIGLAQDTGGVIKGHRLDYYCGAGYQKGRVAFHIKTPARTYLIVSRKALTDTQ